MEAIIAHPAKGAKRSPARKAAVKPQLQDEAAQLQASALQILGFMCSELAETGLDDIPGAAVAAHDADSVVFVLRNPDEIDEPIGVLVALEQLHQHLDQTALCLEAATGLDLPIAIHAIGLVDHIDQYSRRLHAAISGLPATLEDLRALTTFAGVRPFRDRPTPPIRRIQPGTGEKTPAQLMRVLQFAAEQAGNANDILMMLQAIPKLSHEVYVLVNSAQAITQYLGAATDDALGGDISGDFEHWTYGPNFADAGKGDAA